MRSKIFQFLLAGAIGCSLASGAEPRVVVRTGDTGEALVNPCMGWTTHFYSNLIENYGSRLAPSDTLEDWSRLPVILEHEHFGGSKVRNAWGNDLLVKSVEDYHASNMSIHGWPREELAEIRDAVERINRRMGYRIQLREISWPKEGPLGSPFVVETSWANAGVAPCYGGGFWALTLKGKKGGIVSVNVDQSFDMNNLKIGPPEQVPVEKLQSRFTIAFRHLNPGGSHAPQTIAGTYDVFVSVGQRDGRPKIALPLKDDDGQRRYILGQIRVTPGQPN